METTDYTNIAEIEISYNPKIKPSRRPQITCSKDCYDIFLKTWDMGTILIQEDFRIILLNRANRVLGVRTISRGGMTGTMADPKIIFSIALKGLAAGIVMAHNHPSNNLQPSTADNRLTEKIKKGGELLDIQVLDHIIITTEGYTSYADEGWI